jgi:hypothetical protein
MSRHSLPDAERPKRERGEAELVWSRGREDNPVRIPAQDPRPWFRTKQFAWASLALDPEKIFTEPHELERWHRTPPED